MPHNCMIAYCELCIFKI